MHVRTNSNGNSKYGKLPRENLLRVTTSHGLPYRQLIKTCKKVLTMRWVEKSRHFISWVVFLTLGYFIIAYYYGGHQKTPKASIPFKPVIGSNEAKTLKESNLSKPVTVGVEARTPKISNPSKPVTIGVEATIPRESNLSKPVTIGVEAMIPQESNLSKPVTIGVDVTTSKISNISKPVKIGVKATTPKESNLSKPTDSLEVQKPKQEWGKLDNEKLITIVTMYLNLGTFEKGGPPKKYHTSNYSTWMQTWAWLKNPVVAYFDDENMLNHFRSIREALPSNMSTLSLISRKDLKAFNDFDKVKEVFAQRNYPYFPPNTVKPEYSCAVSAKFDALEMALQADLVKTKYMAWLDIGYFRNLLSPRLGTINQTFQLAVPGSFDEESIAITQIWNKGQVATRSPWDIIRWNLVWVATGMMLGIPRVQKMFIEDFRAARQELLDQNMTSTGQQIIAAMYTSKLKAKVRVKMQPYDCGKPPYKNLTEKEDSWWFCLGFVCRLAGMGVHV